MERKKKIILHDQQYVIGGPKAVLDGIVNSYLGSKYDFVRLPQTEACGLNPFKAIKFIVKYSKQISRENADAIYICGLQYIGLLMVISAKLSNVKKIILSVHGSEWDSPCLKLRKLFLMYIIEPLEILLSDSVITVCESAGHTIKPLRHSKNYKGVIYNTFPDIKYEEISKGTIRKELSISREKIVVSSVGRVVYDKGHDTLIDLINMWNDDRYVFIVVGDGNYVQEYYTKCSEAIKRGTLFLLGKRNDVPEILMDSDIFVFTTLHENHSIALLEAVNMHCCALATNVGGNPEIIKDGISGCLFPVRDVKTLKEKLLVLSDDSLRRAFSDNAYDYAKNTFSVENTYGKLERIFDE